MVRHHGMRIFICLTACAIAAALTFPAIIRAQKAAHENLLAALKYRFIGPVGNRADAIVGEPGNPSVIYVGAAAGGIFKTSDGGINWEPIFDHQDVAAIGSLAIAPSAHNTVWAGTGEPFLIRPDYPMGDGIYKSTDAGRTWQRMGLELTGHIGRIVVDPHNPNIVFACALGQAYRPQKERGIFRTTDGGKTWQQVLFVNEDTGCSELSMDAHDPQTIFAGMWQVEIRTWALNSGGTGSGVYVSHDGGDTWSKVSGHGLPDANVPLGKTAVAVAPSDSNRVYALIEEKTPSLYRSEDAGKTWKLVNQQHVMSERAPYYVRFAVAPDDENRLLFVSVGYSVSLDGGNTVSIPGFGGGEASTGAPGYGSSGGDNHDIWIDPLNPKRVMVANDAGASISLNGAKSYRHVQLPIAQVYHVFADNRIPYFVYANRQDGTSFRGPSNNLEGAGGIFGGGISIGEWTHVGGCESGFSIPDPADNNIVWSACYDGELTRMDLRTGQARSVTVWPDATYGWAPADVKYRWHWTFPIAVSPHDHNRVYVGSQYVHETTNGGQSWTIISPDLTTNDKSHQQSSGGIAADNLMTYDGSTLYAIAESPVTSGLIWAGSNDGQVSVTRDGGKNWSNVTKNIPNLPPWGTVENIEPSHFDAGAAYITVNLEQVGNYEAYVYKTTDYGRSWSLISSGVPKSMNSSAHCIIEDPARKGMLYLGTDNSVYVSWDDGGHWTSLRNNMPPAPVYWLTIQPKFNDLVVGTYGRGIWILDDVTPLRDFDKAQSTSNVHLFEPRPAYRFRTFDNTREGPSGSHVMGQNPPYGADINFYLEQGADKGTLAISGADGKTIRTIKLSSLKPGINRVWWDLTYDPATEVKLRTAPPDEPWVEIPKSGYRPVVNWIHFDGAPRVAPGKYTVKLAIDGKDLSAPVEVLPDPHTLGTQQDIESEVKFLLAIRGEMSNVAEMINHIEWTRKQTENLERMFAADEKYAGMLKAAKQLEQQELAAESKLMDVHLSGRTEDSFRNPMGLYGRITNLGALMNGAPGEGSSGADLPPTDQALAVNAMYVKEIAEARSAFSELREKDIAAFNQSLKANHLDLSILP
ncbi:MAG TPA: hypothetical protein VFU57_12185 [Candidatus Acidoferrales bacterium]|nr:hypothetical protein [Candidatus Acidoferrales bacterium]